MKKLIKYGKNTFGFIGLITAIYWALQNAGIGIIGCIFGQEVLDTVNENMSLINTIIPYAVLFIACGFGGLWLIDSVLNYIRKRRNKSLSKAETREEIIEEIKEHLTKVIDLLDNLK